MLVSIASILDAAHGANVTMKANGKNSIGVNVKDNSATLEINGKAIPVDPTFAAEMQKVLISVSEGLETERLKARRSRRLARTLENLAAIPHTAAPIPMKARIGRPPGSKNKPKETPTAIPVHGSTPTPTTSNKRIGRPPGSKNKPKVALPIPVQGSAPATPAPKKIGRPMGSKNKPKVAISAPTPAVPVPVTTTPSAPAAGGSKLPAWCNGVDPNSPK